MNCRALRSALRVPCARSRRLLLASALVACSQQDEPPTEPAAPAAAHTPNVVMYLVDTLRADALSVYGGPAENSPAFEAFARSAAVFEEALAQAPWTLTSVASLFTSTYPTSHRVLDHFDRVGAQAETLAEYMQSLGYRTTGFASNTMGGKSAGFEQGFEQFTEHQLVHSPHVEGEAHPLQALYDWVDADQGEAPQFLYVHTVEPHDPYFGFPSDRAALDEAVQRDNERLQKLMSVQRRLGAQRWSGGLSEADEVMYAGIMSELTGRENDAHLLYNGDVREADDNFQLLLDHLRGNPRWDDAIIVILADHGEEFHEHGSWFHGHSAFQELLHVPLIMRVPGLTDEGARISRRVQLIDVLPTLAELLGGPVSPDWQGRSLVPLLRGEDVPERPVMAMRIYTDEEIVGPRGKLETALLEGPWKLIVHHEVGKASLFDLSTDPGEKHDLSAEQPERTRKMLEQVQARLRELPLLPIRDARALEGEAQAERLRQLQDLGYVEAPSPR